MSENRVGTILNEKYIIDCILGEGGFGITYRGHIISSDTPIAIKEYRPSINVKEHSRNTGLQRFLNEASLLQEFRNLENIVSVYDVFAEDNTAYIIMEYVEGMTMRQYVTEHGVLSFDAMFALMTPLMSALSQIHKKGFVHRDISPDNLIIGSDNLLHLIDFGAASFDNSSDAKTTTVILKPGYAPPEQYVPDGKIGPWTDLYGLCATMYFALTGNNPPDALHRLQEDTLKPMSDINGLSPWQASAIYRGMDLKIAKRPRNMDVLLTMLNTVPSENENKTITVDYIEKNTQRKIQRLERPSLSSKYVAAAILLLCVISTGWIFTKNIHTNDSETDKMTKNTLDQSTQADTETTPDTSSKQEPAEYEKQITEAQNNLLTMINMVGLPFDKASDNLRNLDSDIHIEKTEAYSDLYDKGIVIKQSVLPDTQFTIGTIQIISLTVSNGPEPAAATNNATNKPATKTTETKSTTEGKPDDGYTTIHLK